MGFLDLRWRDEPDVAHGRWLGLLLSPFHCVPAVVEARMLPAMAALFVSIRTDSLHRAVGLAAAIGAVGAGLALQVLRGPDQGGFAGWRLDGVEVGPIDAGLRKMKDHLVA